MVMPSVSQNLNCLVTMLNLSLILEFFFYNLRPSATGTSIIRCPFLFLDMAKSSSLQNFGSYRSYWCLSSVSTFEFFCSSWDLPLSSFLFGYFVPSYYALGNFVLNQYDIQSLSEVWFFCLSSWFTKFVRSFLSKPTIQT